MFLSFTDIINLFIRFLAVGQLSLLSFYVLSQARTSRSILATSLSICLCAYLLLTAPIPNQHYGLFRGILLFFTEITPYILWLFAFSLLNDRFQSKSLPRWSKGIIISALLWFLYFFGYLQGKGTFHQINHAVELSLLIHVIFISIKGLADDLVNARRNVRILLVLYTCIYFSFVLMLELGDSSFRDSSVFSIINAFIILLSTSMIAWSIFNNKFKDETAKSTIKIDTKAQVTVPEIPRVFQNAYQSLCQLMADGFYKETQLSISQLASKLKIPEHQLRVLINQHLGFRNFSEYLNSYRLSAACSQLEDINNLRKPILTIALELGYGSIATFNRAFKEKTGKTPKEYRNQFQK